jgi:hypothetical protein
MTEKDRKSQSTFNEFERYERQGNIALEASREAIKRLNITEFSPDTYNRSDSPWNVLFQDVGDDIMLNIELNPDMNTANVTCTLRYTAAEMLDDLERIFSTPEALELFDFNPLEKDEIILETLIKLLMNYISHLPIVLFHSFYQSVKESVISNIKTLVEPDYKESWAIAEKPKAFTLLPTKRLTDLIKLFPGPRYELLNYVESVDKQYAEYRHNSLKSMQHARTPERMANLHVEYEQIRKTYQRIKKEYQLEHDAYSRINVKAREISWLKHWKAYLTKNFKTFPFSKADLNRTPSELAYIYLGKQLGYSSGTVEAKVVNSRAFAEERKQRANRKEF